MATSPASYWLPWLTLNLMSWCNLTVKFTPSMSEGSFKFRLCASRVSMSYHKICFNFELIFNNMHLYSIHIFTYTYVRDKVFKNGPRKICGRQLLKNLKGYGLLSRPYPFIFLKAAFHKFHLVHSWILCPICSLIEAFIAKFVSICSSPFHLAMDYLLKFLDSCVDWEGWWFEHSVL